MNLKTFFEHFDTLAEAPNGIQRLRELILDMAVRGKLVPQDPEDEPVEKLLSILESQKKGLRKKGKIPQQKKLYSVTPEEFLFEIPASWSWERMAYIFDVRDGTHDTPQYVSEGIPFLTSKNISSGKLDFESCKFIREVDHIEFSKRSHVEKGDIIFAMIGSIGNPVLVDTDKEFSIKNVALFKSFLPQDMDLNFLKVYLDYATNLMKDSSSGAVQRFVSLTFLRNYPFPLPPLAEQKRIVAKVDELMALCDALEAAQQTRNTLRQKLRASALDGLMNAPSDTDLETAWAFISDNWGLMCDRPEDVEGLRQVVLRMAIRGKVTQPEINDKSATALLKSIKEKGLALAKAKAFKKYKPLEILESDSLCFEIPNNWCWAKLSDLGEFLGGGTPSKANSEYWNGDIPWISPKDMKVLYLEGSQDHISEIALHNSSAQLIPVDSLLMVVRGMILAHSFPTAINKKIVAINQDMKALSLIDKDMADYLLIVSQALRHLILEKVNRSSHGTCKIASDNIENFLVPLPPLAEQKRIVAKVDELMKLCDQLEASLRQQHQRAEALVASVVHHFADLA